MEATNQPSDEVHSHLPLSVDEEQVLRLYDQLQELRLEIAIINAQGRQTDDDNGTTTEDMELAQREMLEARAKYMLRNQVVETVMSANPILKAVHGSKDSSQVETDLLPYIEKRDDIAISTAKLTKEMSNVRDEMIKVQSETLRATRQNIDLADQVFDLAAEVKSKKAGRPDDPKVLQEIEKLEEDVKVSSRRWRVIKGVASGVVVGTGVDWASDDALCDIVLDPEDD